MKAALAALLFTLVALGCGDGVIIVSFTTGTVVGDPLCHDGSGQFDLRDQAGLLVLVVINAGTQIVLNDGRPGTCTDLGAGAQAEVGGTHRGTTVTARSVRLI